MKKIATFLVILSSFGLMSCEWNESDEMEREEHRTIIQATQQKSKTTVIPVPETKIINEGKVDDSMIDDVVGELFKDVK